MYVVVEPTNTVFLDKTQAEEAARRVNGTVYVPVVQHTPEKLELLYGLTLQLLKVGKIDPLHITLEITNLLGETETITARKVMNDARAWIDTTESLGSHLLMLAQTSVDPAMKAKLERLAGALA